MGFPELRPGDLVQRLALLLQMLVELDRLLLHQGMGVPGPPVETKIVPPGDPAVSVPVVKPQSEKK